VWQQDQKIQKFDAQCWNILQQNTEAYPEIMFKQNWTIVPRSIKLLVDYHTGSTLNLGSVATKALTKQ
jgi:hypothetical protein